MNLILKEEKEMLMISILEQEIKIDHCLEERMVKILQVTIEMVKQISRE
jgi:hypothetical protein